LEKVIEGHAIFYIVDEDKHEVIICHIYYAKRDIPKFEINEDPDFDFIAKL
jgi:hypothetical protein